MTNMKLSRRQFLAGSATVTGGLVLGITFTNNTVEAMPNARTDSVQPNAWLQITPNNEVIFQLDKTEMGQGVYTSLPTILAEELEIDPRAMIIEMAQVHSDFQDPMQMTGGSTSVTTRWDILRETGAKARMMLIAAAAKGWGVDAADCYADNGRIYRRDTGDSVSFGDVASAASKEKVPEQVVLKQNSEFKYVGKSLRRFDGIEKSTGQSVFGIDVEVEGAANAVVLRNPHFNKIIGTWNATAAREATGVVDIFEISTGIAVVADTYWHARKAAELIEVNWDKGNLAGVSSESIRADWIRLSNEDGKSVQRDGEGAKALATAASIHEAAYEVPYLAHATMEPQNTTASFKDGMCEVWSPNQGPDITQALVADALGLRRDKVTVYTTMMGGGFGRRGIPDFAVEAAEVSKHIGRPAKVIWSREDDTRHDYYRPATYNLMRAGLDESGMVHTWQHKLVAPSMVKSLLPNFSKLAPRWMPTWLVNALASGASAFIKTRDPSTTEGAVELPYEIANVDIQHVYHDPGIPLGFWRSVGHSQNAFIIEGFVDELAHKAGEDPYQFRRKLLANHPAHIAVLDVAAKESNWGNTPDDIYQGIAIHKSFGSIVAEVVDVRMVNGKPKLEKVTCAVDCGTAVNPDQVRAQIESGVVYGLTAALMGKITIRDGAVEQSNLHDYPMLRMSETPEIVVHILPSTAKPTGVGEPGTPPIAPAVANALFAATGNRQRALPISLSV